MPAEKEHTETLTLSYESKAERADAKAVGAGILTIQSMIDEVQKGFTDNERILVKARPFARGSLDVPLDLIVLGTVIILNEYPLLQKVREIVTQYFDIKKRLRGQPIEVEDGNLIVIENSTIRVDEITLNLLDPCSSVSKTASDTFRALEDDPDITGVRVSSSVSSQPLAHILRDEFRYYHPETAGVNPSLGRRCEETRETLIIRQPAFEVGLTWRFVWRGMKITAQIQDEAFQKRVEKGRELFAAGDTLDVDLRRFLEYDPAAATYLYVQGGWVIVRVHAHKRRRQERQGELFEQ